MKQCMYAIVFVFLIFCVTDYNTRIEEQYVFENDEEKQNFLKGKIINKTNSSNAVSTVVSELLLVPDSIWKKFFMNGGNIIITYDLPVKDAVGTFSQRILGKYVIYIHPNYIRYAFLHEVGHYLGYVENVCNDRRFIKSLSEYDKAMQGVLNNNLSFKGDSEYFAEMFNLYFHNKIDSSEFPLFTSYVETVLSDYK